MVWGVASQRILKYLAFRKGSFYSGIVIHIFSTFLTKFLSNDIFVSGTIYWNSENLLDFSWNWNSLWPIKLFYQKLNKRYVLTNNIMKIVLRERYENWSNKYVRTYSYRNCFPNLSCFFHILFFSLASLFSSHPPPSPSLPPSPPLPPFSITSISDLLHYEVHAIWRCRR